MSADHRPGGPQGPGGEVPGSPERDIPEAFRGRTELYPIEGSDYIIAIKEAIEIGEIGMITEAVDDSIGFMEGLYFGKEASNYDLGDTRVVVDLMNMFTTIEESTDRPSFTNVFQTIRDQLSLSVREAGRYERNPARWRAGVVRERTRHWQMVNQGREERGVGYDGRQLQERITLDVQNEERRIQSLVDHKKDLIGLKDHVDARVLIFDQAFIQRQKTCGSAGEAAKLGENGIKPDKGHWIAYYQGNRESQEAISRWGEAVSETEKVIYNIAIGKYQVPGIVNGRDLFIEGFKTAGEFKAFLQTLLKHGKVDGVARMDVVWAAWRMSLWKEVISKVAWKVDSKAATYKFASPPFASSLIVNAIHSEKVRANEWGWFGVLNKRGVLDLDQWKVVDMNGQVLERGGDLTEREFQMYINQGRAKLVRGVSASGHPFSIGRVGPFTDAYMHRTIIKNWENPRTRRPHKEISLFSIWYEEGISMASSDFPWADTEIRGEGEPIGEAPGASVEGWFTDRGRSHTIRTELVLPIPDVQALTIKFLESSSMRALEKAKKIRPGPLVNGIPENPMAWIIGAILIARSISWSSNKDTELVKRDLHYSSRDLQNKTAVVLGEGQARAGAITAEDFLNDAYWSQVISKEEYDWLLKNLA